MPSSMALAEAVIRERLALPVPAEVFTQPNLVGGLRTYSDHIVDAVCDELDITHSLKESDGTFSSVAGYGLEVAIWGLGQVIRQSADARVIGTEVRRTRLTAGCEILKLLTYTPKDATVSTEIAYGLIPQRFSSPRYPLRILGSTVELSHGLIGGASAQSRGCPFRLKLQNIYPQIVSAMTDFYELSLGETDSLE